MESFQIFKGWRDCLAENGLDNFDALFGYVGGKMYKNAHGRVTTRIALNDTAGGSRNVFIKRFRNVPLQEALRRLFSFSRPVSFARRELDNISRLAEVGINSLTPVALGERLGFRGLAEQSFIVTEEVPGGTRADEFFAEHFSATPDVRSLTAKRRLICLIAELARRLHDGRLNHRDFYLCHIFVRPVAGAEPVLHLLDLGRVMRHGRLRRGRWLIKDIAALNYSAGPLPVSRADRVRFIKAYFDVRKLNGRHKKFIRKVLAKSRRIARHDARIRARKQGEQR